MIDAHRLGDQLGFDLGERPPRHAYEPNLDEIREDLAAILAAARGVTADAPWDEREFRYNGILVRQMTRWLPEDEAERLCADFAIEAERIERLLAA